MFYVVIELQDAGTPAILPTIYTDLSQAEAKYYTVLSAAAVSQVPLHGCLILRSDGVVSDSKIYDRRGEE